MMKLPYILRPAAFCLFVGVTASGCFVSNDNTTTTLTTASATTPTTTQETESATDTGDDTTTDDATTEGATTEGPTTDGPSTSETDPTETDATGVTTSNPMCPEDAMCTPGDVQVGDPCGSCGNQERHCTDECTWSDWSCNDGPDQCDIWILDTELGEWDGMRAEANGGEFHRPTLPIRAAIDVNAKPFAYVFTDTTYHVLNLDSHTWVDSGERNELFPDLDGLELLAAYSVPDQENMVPMVESITVLTAGFALVYTLAVDEVQFEYQTTVPCCDQWAPEELRPDELKAQASWLSLEDYPWEHTAEEFCGMPLEGVLTRYGGVISEGKVHIQDSGYCHDFVEKHNFNEFEPMTLPGGPPSAEVVGGAFWHDRLYILREDIDQ